MVEDILGEVRLSGGLKNAIMGGVELERATSAVTVKLITDLAYTEGDYNNAYSVVRRYVPQEFSLQLSISKLTPDCAMVKRRIISAIGEKFPAFASVTGENDIEVKRDEDGFSFYISIFGDKARGETMIRAIEEELKKSYCGTFRGFISQRKLNADEITVEREVEEEAFEAPVRTFPVCDYSPIESADAPSKALYMADFNFIGENIVVCGRVLDVSERSYTRSNGEEKPYFNIALTDGTATLRLTYFSRKKSVDKIREIKADESIVCYCRSEVHGGMLRYTATRIDYGAPPKDFVPEKRKTRPVPKAYHTIKPEPFTDYTQTDFFTDTSLPECFKNTSFVVFDLETTGLSTTPVSGEMDGIIEIGAYKVINGEIKEKFSTFVNPERPVPLEQRIVELTGITDEMVKSAPSYRDVLPDFVKFCDGSVLVGHNAAGFDFKFIDYYCRELGYAVDNRVIDTLFLSQKLLRLSNNKLNTVADHFGITFNHHRAEDDALATAKIFIELIKIKKSLPDY